jgi:hypothetical protein
MANMHQVTQRRNAETAEHAEHLLDAFLCELSALGVDRRDVQLTVVG